MTDVEKWAKYALDYCGKQELFPILDFNYRHNMTKNLGSALYSPNYGRPYGRIALSKEWFSILPEQDQIDTVIHEVCHIVVEVEIAQVKIVDVGIHAYTSMLRENRLTNGHCKVWVKKMEVCGLPPVSCYVGDRKLDVTVPGYCLCKEWKLTKQRAGRIRNCTNAYYCKSCKGTIRLTK
jgi:predicted SprT family Zn-dependent metalloprotease